jgi:antirestriction protein ArdC
LGEFKLEHHASYLEGYLKLLKEDPKLLFNSAYSAQKAVNYLLDIDKNK